MYKHLATLLLCWCTLPVFAQVPDATAFKNSYQDNAADFFPDLAPHFKNFQSNGYHPAEWARVFIGSFLHHEETVVVPQAIICNDPAAADKFDLQHCATYWKIPLGPLAVRPLMPPLLPVKSYNFFMDGKGKLWTNGSSVTRCQGASFFPIKKLNLAPSPHHTVLSYFTVVLHPDGPILLTPDLHNGRNEVAVTRLGQ